MKISLDTNGGWRAWIAELDQRPIGNIWVQIIEKIPNPTDELEFYGYITNFYIIEELRGRGFGSELLETALDWCRSNDAHAVVLWPSQKSRSLYLRHGFATPDDLFQLIL
jgi:GNAT superfamily N-acetyltransferase